MANPALRWQLENLRMTLRPGRDLARQVEAALNWINTAALPEDRILMDFPGYRAGFIVCPPEYRAAGRRG